LGSTEQRRRAKNLFCKFEDDPKMLRIGRRELTRNRSERGLRSETKKANQGLQIKSPKEAVIGSCLEKARAAQPGKG